MNSVSSNLSPALAGGVPLEALLASSADASRAASSSATADSITPRAPAKTPSAAGTKKTAASSRTTSSAKKTSTASAKKTTASSAKKTTSTSKAGYAATASLPKDLAFLRDAKLSVEEKLVRLAAYLNARSEAEIQKKMEALAGGASAKAGSTSQTGAKPKPKKKGFWSKSLSAVQVMFPAVGLSMQLLKTPATRNALKQVGGPVLAAAATALGFPQAAPALLRYGPGVVDFAAGALQAVEKAATAEDKAAAEPAAAASGGSSSAGAASGTGAAKNEQLELLELTRLLDQQKLLMSTISNVLKSMHDTKTHIIGNLR